MMKEKNIHDLIERQSPEIKQRIWEKILNNLPELGQQNADVQNQDLDICCKSNLDKDKVSK